MKVRQNGAAWEVISEAGLVVSSHESEEAANAQLATLQQVVAEALRPVPTEGELQLDGRFLRLVETDQGIVWEVCLIEEGWSKNRRYYSAEVLEAAIPFFEGLSAGYYRDEAHTSLDPNELAGNLAGWYEGAHGKRDPDTGKFGIYARFQCIDPALGRSMAEAWRRNKRDLLGFSIHALGETVPGLAEGRSGDIVTKIHGVAETTVVRSPAAGGRVVRLVAAINHVVEDNIMLKKWLKARLTAKGRDASGVDALEGKGLCEAVVAQLKEGPTDQVVLGLAIKWIDTDAEKAKELLQTLIDGGAAAAEEAPAPMAAPGMYEAVASAAKSASEQATAAVAQAQQMLHEAKVEGCKTTLNQVLAEAKLSGDVEKILRKQFEGQVFDRNVLLETVDEFQKAFDPPGAQNGGVDQGQPRFEIIAEAKDKMVMALQKAMGYKPELDNVISEAEKMDGVAGITEAEKSKFRAIGAPPSIREIYIALTGDTKVRGRYGPGALCEATTSDFANTLGVAMNRTTRQYMSAIPNPFNQLFHENTNMNDMKTQEVDLWGGFAELPVVSEGATYTAAGFPREERSTYSPQKRGNVIPLTWEMFLNDNLRVLQDIPRKLARATMHTIMLQQGKALIGNLAGSGINADTVFTGSVLYHANHRNKTTTALGYSAYIAARQQLESQYERGVSTLIDDAGGISNVDTSCGADSTTGFIAGMYIQIDAEIIGPLPAPTNGTTFDFTGVRGALGTTAASHSDDARIYALVHPLPLNRFFTVVPTELRATLFELLNSELLPELNTNTKNFLAAEAEAGHIVPLVVPTVYLGGDVTNWYNVADPADVPGLEMGALFGQWQGETFVQKAGTEGAVFTDDEITYKQRLVCGFKQIDFTGLQGNIVAG